MTKKDYLNQAFKLNEEIKLKKKELKNLRDRAEKIKSSNYENDRIDVGNVNDCISEIIARIVDFEKEIRCDEMKYTKIKHKISEKINTIDDVILKLILQKRYLDFMSIEEIADYIYYSRTDTYRKYNLALKQIKI